VHGSLLCRVVPRTFQKELLPQKRGLGFDKSYISEGLPSIASSVMFVRVALSIGNCVPSTPELAVTIVQCTTLARECLILSNTQMIDFNCGTAPRNDHHRALYSVSSMLIGLTTIQPFHSTTLQDDHCRGILQQIQVQLPVTPISMKTGTTLVECCYRSPMLGISVCYSIPRLHLCRLPNRNRMRMRK
jgi:hypothetical protein